jgi:hypothetical protein
VGREPRAGQGRSRQATARVLFSLVALTLALLLGACATPRGLLGRAPVILVSIDGFVPITWSEGRLRC